MSEPIPGRAGRVHQVNVSKGASQSSPWNARVLREGPVAPGDLVEVTPALA